MYYNIIMNSFFNTDRNAQANKTMVVNDNIVNRYCCEFDGTPQYYEGAFADSFPFRSDRQWSVSFWINRRQTSGRATIFDNRQSGTNNNGNLIEFDATSRLRLVIKDGGSVVIDVETQDGMLGSILWRFITITWDGTLPTPVCKMYMNGQEQQLIINSQNIANVFTGANNDHRYALSVSGTIQFDGMLKDWGVWETTLSQDQIKYLYNRGIPNNLNATNFSGFLKHWFRFGDGSGGAGSDDNTQIIDVSREGIANLAGFGVPAVNCPILADPMFIA